jgi:N-terminal domain of galactosyltransferase
MKMISIIITYCPSRRKLFEATWAVLSTYQIVNSSQKIICCDGECDINPSDMDVLSIPRTQGYYSWSRVMEAGIIHAKHDSVLCIDCDRVFDESYLKLAIQLLDDNTVVSPKDTYTCDISFSKDIFTRKDNGQPELRIEHPPDIKKCLVGKNPFSGNSLFSRSLYTRLGGYDHQFLGYGHSDTDLYLRASQNNTNFKFVDIPEFHLIHKTELDDHMHIAICAYNICKLYQKYGGEPVGMENLFNRHLITSRKAISYLTLDEFLRSLKILL